MLAVAVLIGGGAYAQEDENRTLDAIKTDLAQIEQILSQGVLDDTQLNEIGGRVDAQRANIDKVAQGISPRLQAIETRLQQLGPKPAEGAPPESPELAQEREAQTQAKQPIEETLKRASALIVQTDQLAETVAQKRRDEFASRVLSRSRSLLDPNLWLNVIDEAPRRMAAARGFVQQWAWQISDRMTPQRGAVLGIAILLALLLLGPVRIWIQRYGQRYAAEQVPATRLRRSAAAIWVILITTAAPIAAAMVLYVGLTGPGFVPERAVPFLGVLVRLVAFVGFIAGLSQAIFAPRSASWRIPPIADDTAVRLARYPLWIAGVFALARSIQAFFDIIGVGLSTTILIDGLAAALITLMFAVTIRPVKAAEEEHASEHPAEPGQEFRLFGLLRLAAWIAVVVIVAALVLGYVSLGFFLATQLIWLSTLGAVLYILMALVDDLFTGWGPTSAVSRFARGTIGLRSESFDQLCALVSGLLRLILIVIAIMLAAAPWGIQSGDATSWIRRAFAGITLGGFSLSPGAILGAIAFIAGGLLLTRAVQRWLDASYLPRTRLDDGLKNSIRTATGYAGTILAIGLAISSLGFGLDRIAIVAGALSVGIGFGLQSIVSNFVSGLILLAERPIKVGDWIGIGPDEGNVRRISVRSTVIEMFDRSTLIVPNSDLITKSVRNRTHSNPLGRVSLQIGTAHQAPVAEIKQILLTSASEIAGVLKTPAPEVLITGTTDLGVQWTLICAVATPRQVAATRSELYFAVLQRLQAKNVKITASAAA